MMSVYLGWGGGIYIFHLDKKRRGGRMRRMCCDLRLIRKYEASTPERRVTFEFLHSEKKKNTSAGCRSLFVLRT